MSSASNINKSQIFTESFVTKILIIIVHLIPFITDKCNRKTLGIFEKSNKIVNGLNFTMLIIGTVVALTQLLYLYNFSGKTFSYKTLFALGNLVMFYKYIDGSLRSRKRCEHGNEWDKVSDIINILIQVIFVVIAILDVRGFFNTQKPLLSST